MTYNFQPRQKYSFETYAPQLLGNEFKAVTVRTVMDYQDAIKEEDVFALHKQVLGYISDPTVTVPADFKKLTYLKLITSIGKTRIIAAEWIIEDTIQSVNLVDIDVKVFRTDPSKVAIIREALAQNGITNFEINATSVQS